MIEFKPMLLKLTSGETIICDIDNNDVNIYDKRFINVKNPAILNHVRLPRGDYLVESYILFPWCSFSSEDNFNIPTSHIIVATNVKDELKNNYKDFIMRKSDKRSNDETELDFEDEETLDDFLNVLEERLETDGTEEEDKTAGRGSTKSTRILH